MKAQNWTLTLNIIFSEILLKIQILKLVRKKLENFS
jgi:hypothetical protein